MFGTSFYIHIFIYMYIELNFEPELYLQQFFKILKPLIVKWQLLYKKQTNRKSKVIFVVSSQEYMYIQWRIIRINWSIYYSEIHVADCF